MKQKTVYRWVFAAAVVAVFVTGVPLRASETDDRIESSFNNTYVYKIFLKDDAVRIEAKAGEVTLTGTVAEESHKGLAQETAASLPGVTHVDNQLAIKIEVAVENVDERIARRVHLTLLFHRDVNACETVVEVKDGIVTLKGEASSLAQRDLIAEYAKDIDGVSEVKNEMTIAATPEKAKRTAAEMVDDASITAQVRTALFTHRSTNSMKTKVQTLNGEVTLTGVVKNAAEMVLVVKLVEGIQGVTSVKDLMTIEETAAK